MPGSSAGGMNRQLELADGTVLGGSGAQATPVSTKAYEVGDLDTFGVHLQMSAGDATQMDVEESFDGGTTWTKSYPGVENDLTPASVALAVGNISKYWASYHPSIADPATVDENASPVQWGDRPLVRFTFTGGASITLDDARIVAKTYVLRGH